MPNVMPQARIYSTSLYSTSHKCFKRHFLPIFLNAAFDLERGLQRILVSYLPPIIALRSNMCPVRPSQQLSNITRHIIHVNIYNEL